MVLGFTYRAGIRRTAHKARARGRDIRRKIARGAKLRERYAELLALAMRVPRPSPARAEGAPHAPEVECMASGKPGLYEFGCKVRVVTPATKPTGGRFVLHAQALHGNSY